MPRKMAGTPTYRVLNPRGVPQDIPVLTLWSIRFYAGDVFEPRSGADIAGLLERGFIERVRDG